MNETVVGNVEQRVKIINRGNNIFVIILSSRVLIKCQNVKTVKFFCWWKYVTHSARAKCIKLFSIAYVFHWIIYQYWSLKQPEIVKVPYYSSALASPNILGFWGQCAYGTDISLKLGAWFQLSWTYCILAAWHYVQPHRGVSVGKQPQPLNLTTHQYSHKEKCYVFQILWELNWLEGTKFMWPT